MALPRQARARSSRARRSRLRRIDGRAARGRAPSPLAELAHEVKAFTLTVFLLGVSMGLLLRGALIPCQPTVISAPWEATPR